ncbi:MAG: hypothetical protein MRJ66_16570 [Nitrospira sp.]|nr:hypothetical protein [Nitrospira sp.]
MATFIVPTYVGHAAELVNNKISIYEKSLQSAEAALLQLGLPDEKLAVLRDKAGATQAITAGLKLLPEILKDPVQAQKLGFSATPGPKNIEDEGFPIIEIRRDDLRHFYPGANVSGLLIYTNQVILPVDQASLTIRFSIEKKDKPGPESAALAWRPVRWGQPKLISQLKNAQKLNPGAKPGFLASVPSLNRDFLGYKDADALKLIPLFDDRLLHFTNGQAIVAEKVFERLAEEARSMDERPR